MDKILKSTGSQITLRLYDSSGALANADAPPAVKVNNGAGVEHIASSASVAAGTGTYTKALTPAQTAILDVYAGIWTAAIGGVAGNIFTERFEIVGGFYFTLAEARAFDNAAMASTTTYPPTTLVEARDLVEESIEKACGVAFVPRSRRITLDGSDRTELVIPDLRPRELIAASIGGTALSAGEIADVEPYAHGVLYREAGWPAGARNVVLHYAHGYDQAPDAVRRAALVLLRNRLVSSNIGDRAISFTDELGTTALAVAGYRGQTFGIPEVDSVVQEYCERVPAIG